MTFAMIVLSSSLFQGYQTLVNIDECETLAQVVSKVVDALVGDLRNLNLEVLVEEARRRPWHIHTVRCVEALRSSAVNNIAEYVCDHCDFIK